MRITIRVRPGSARPGVCGEHAGALVVRVSARAVDGKATDLGFVVAVVALAVIADLVGQVRGACGDGGCMITTAMDPILVGSRAGCG